MSLNLKGILCLYKQITNIGFHVWLNSYHSSFDFLFSQSLLSSQLIFILWGKNPLDEHYNSWLYTKYVHPQYGDKIIVTNTNPHAL